MRKNHSKIVCIKLVHLLTFIYDARSHLRVHQTRQLLLVTVLIYDVISHRIRPAVFFLLPLQPPLGVVFYSPLVGFSLLAYEVS